MPLDGAMCASKAIKDRILIWNQLMKEGGCYQNKVICARTMKESNHYHEPLIFLHSIEICSQPSSLILLKLQYCGINSISSL